MGSTSRQKYLVEPTYKSFKEIRAPADVNISKNFRSNSLDSLANSSNPSESDDSQSDSDGRAKHFQTKCEVYAENSCGSIRSWTKSEGSISEHSYEYVSSEHLDRRASVDKKFDQVMARMETIPEEGAEPKVSVKEILARFENLKGGDSCKDLNNNSRCSSPPIQKEVSSFIQIFLIFCNFMQ